MYKRQVNVPETIPHEDPVWNIPNKRYEVGDPITINPLADGELTGTSPITISVTSIEDNPSATALPFGLSLANNIINGVAPTVTATTIRTVYLTAANIDSDGTTHKTHVTFTITVVPEPEPGDPHVNPSWNIPNKSYPEDQGFKIDPITNNELTGTSPLTITVTPTSADPNATALPSWLTQNGNIFTGAVTDVSADTDFEIYLTATNTDSSNVVHSSRTNFTITRTNVVAPVAPHINPAWNIQNKRYQVGDPISINPIANGELTGTPPITISITSIADNPNATGLPFGLSLSNNIINGTIAPTVTATTIRTVYLTATNTDSDGVDHKTHITFTITVFPAPDPGDPHVDPTWDIPNKSYPEDQGFTIDPISNGELTGDRPLTITVTPTSVDPNAQPLPSYLTQTGNIFIGSTTDVTTDTVDETVSYTHLTLPTILLV